MLGFAENVQTLPDSYDPAEPDYLYFKTGLYNKWSHPEINTLDMYFDDVELFIGEDIRVEDVCQECVQPSSVRRGKAMPWLNLLLLEE